MRRRILAAILGVVAAALVLTGTGTYLLLQSQAAGTTEAGLRAQTGSMVRLVDDSRGLGSTPADRRKILRGLKVEGVAVRLTDADGQTIGTLPEGVVDGDIDQSVLDLGGTVSGRHGDLVWAAAGLPRTNGTTLSVVMTAPVEAATAPVGWYFLSAAVVCALAAVVAWVLSGTLTRPLRNAQAATARIAGGDLDTTLPEPRPKRRDEMAQLTRSINAMAGALARSRGAERQFLLSVSHDLRTPLTSIRGWSEAIVDGTAPDPTMAAGVIGGEAQRLERLVDDLLELARLDSATYTFHPQVVPVGEVVTEAVEAFRPAAQTEHLSLEVVDTADGVRANVDPDRLTQAVANLVENGLRYASTGLVVRISADGAVVRISVDDDGPGIADTDLVRVFDRRYVTDQRPNRRPQAPSGLGLAIVHDLVTAMGGTVTARSSTEGPGASLVIELPLDGAST